MSKRNSIKKILIYSIWITYIVVLLSSLILTSMLITNNYKKQAIIDSQNKLEYMMSQMSTLSDNILDVHRLLTQNTDISSFLDTPKSNDLDYVLKKYAVSEVLSQILSSYRYIDAITLSRWDGYNLTIDSRHFIEDSNDNVFLSNTMEELKNLPSINGIFWFGTHPKSEVFPPYYPVEKTEVVTFLLPIINIWEPDHHSSIYIHIPRNFFDFLYTKNGTQGSNIYLYSPHGDLLLSAISNADIATNSQEYGMEIKAQEEASLNGAFFKNTGNEPYYCTYQIHPLSQWILLEEIPLDHLISSMKPIQTSIILTFSISSLILLVITYLLMNKILSVFQKMSSLMLDIGKGDLSQRLSPMDYTEFDIITVKFNSMMDQIENLVQKNKLVEEEKRVLEIDTLQAQINPHFIYNSLTTIRFMASMARANNVCNALLALTNTLRPIFNETTILWPLKNELNFIENYIDIMNYRFGDTIKYVCEVPPELYSIKILRFILQPVVENAITHGLHNQSSGTLTIRTTLKDSFIYIYISDNGCGIESATLDLLNHSFLNNERIHTSSDGHNYGLYNINRRIKLQYGNTSSLFIDSTPTQGTTTAIVIPI